MSRKWAHWHGLELQITSAAQLKFIGVAKKTRTSRVVATVYHSHCRGAPEALLLRIKGVKLLPDYNQPRVTVRRSLAFTRDAQHLRLMQIQTMMWCCPLVIRKS